MSIPYDQIHADIKAKTLTRINQLFEYGTMPEWKEEIGFRKGPLERLIEDPKRFTHGHGHKIAMGTGIKETIIRRLIEEQKKYNWAMKREGGQKGERPGPQRGPGLS